MDVLKRMGDCGVVPVVVLDKVEDALPTANALLSGGADVIEVTLRTPAALDCIRQIAQNCPEICVGAGTVLSVQQCEQAVDAGALFVVAPGFDREVVQWCIQRQVAVVPGAITPTEITLALSLGIKVLKFFPSYEFGGLPAMKALSGPFGEVKFIPTSNLEPANLCEYLSAPFIHATGGTWMCERQDILDGKFARITEITARMQRLSLGFELAHIGINCDTPQASIEVCELFERAFLTGIKEGDASNFASPGIEVMKSRYLGDNGHIAMRTNKIERAIAALAKKGFAVDMQTAKYKGDAMIAVYLKEQFGGFAVHLLQK